MRQYFLSKPRLSGIVLTSLLLSACAGDGDFNFTPFEAKSPVISKPLIYASINPDKITTAPRQLAAQGVKALDEGDLDLALKSFNQALKLKMTDSTLNFLAGLTYHLMAIKGDDSKFFLAEEGYKLAIKFDNSNWYAYFQSGLLAMDQRKFVQAQSRFSEALIYNATDTDLLYSMLVASYYAGDIPTSAVMRDRLSELEPGSPRLLQASVMTSAALNNTDKATASLARFAALDGTGNQAGTLKRRMADWRSFHDNNIQLAQSWQETIGSSAPPPSDPSTPAAAPTTPVTPADPSDGSDSDSSDNSDSSDSGSDQDSSDGGSSTASTAPAIDPNGMVIVDVTIIRTQENHTTAKGVNLLNGLTMQFGDESGTGTAGFSAIDTISKVVGSNTKTITRAINIPAITYSMNIANVNDTRNEILARPTLTATNGSESKFFSGVHIQAAVMPSTTDGSGGSGVTFDDEVGVKLSVTPTLLDDGRVKMDVSAERKYLNTPDSSYTGFTSKLESSRTTVSATVAMQFGETLILSGLSEKETEKIRDGVPLLQDIPIIQYLFSRKTTSDYTKSVMILLTPRQPQYTYQKGKTTGPKAGQNPALSELRSRHMDWFNPYATAETIFNHTQSNRYYRELRTGDVSLERWEDYEGFYGRLKNVLGFLYY
ncbi:MAG: hypothetical protein HQ513_03780 [Rhodospirillales bacterium]|nr:hypothetical protein [Rhodospirillales bacterium]